MAAIFSIIEKILLKAGIKMSETTASILLIAMVINIASGFILNDFNKFLLFAISVWIIGIFLLCDIFSQRKYLIKKCPYMDCRKWVRLKKDSNEIEIICPSCKKQIKTVHLKDYRDFKIY